MQVGSEGELGMLTGRTEMGTKMALIPTPWFVAGAETTTPCARPSEDPLY